MTTSAITSVALAAVTIAGGATFLTTRNGDRVDAAPVTQHRTAAAPPGELPAARGTSVLAVKVAGRAAVTFDLHQLDAMPQVRLRRDEPFVHRTMTFTGVRLADLLTYVRAPASSRTFAASAHDGYTVRSRLKELAAADAILATRVDDHAIPIAKGGPTRIVFPVSEHAVARNTDHWIWSLQTIELR